MGKKQFSDIGRQTPQEYNSPGKGTQTRWALGLHCITAQREFPDIEQKETKCSMVVSLCWKHRDWSLRWPRWLDFMEQSTREKRTTYIERDFQKFPEGSLWVFQLYVISACIWRNYPRLGRERATRKRTGKIMCRNSSAGNSLCSH